MAKYADSAVGKEQQQQNLWAKFTITQHGAHFVLLTGEYVPKVRLVVIVAIVVIVVIGSAHTIAQGCNGHTHGREGAVRSFTVTAIRGE
jgi:hypothetical protein